MPKKRRIRDDDEDPASIVSPMIPSVRRSPRRRHVKARRTKRECAVAKQVPVTNRSSLAVARQDPRTDAFGFPTGGRHANARRPEGMESQLLQSFDSHAARNGCSLEHGLAFWSAPARETDPVVEQLLLADGMPWEKRRQLWLCWSGARDRKVQAGDGYYQNLVESDKGDDGDDDKRDDDDDDVVVETMPGQDACTVIEADLTRTCTDHRYFMDEAQRGECRRRGNCGEEDCIDDGHGRVRLRRILRAFAKHDPAIGYLQGMNFIAAFLLIVFSGADMDTETKTETETAIEEDVFWTLASIVQGPLKGYYSDGLSQLLDDSDVMSLLISRHMPRLGAHFEALGVEMPMFTPGWFITLFFSDFAPDITAHVWDLFFWSGDKGGAAVLWWVALGLFNAEQGELLEIDNLGGVTARIKNYAMRRLPDLRTLIAAASELISLQDLKQSVRSLRTSELQQHRKAAVFARQQRLKRRAASVSSTPNSNAKKRARIAATDDTFGGDLFSPAAAQFFQSAKKSMGDFVERVFTPKSGKKQRRRRSFASTENQSGAGNDVELTLRFDEPEEAPMM